MLNVLMSRSHDAFHIQLHVTIYAQLFFIYFAVLITSKVYSSFPGSNLLPISSLQFPGLRDDRDWT